MNFKKSAAQADDDLRAVSFAFYDLLHHLSRGNTGF